MFKNITCMLDPVIVELEILLYVIQCIPERPCPFLSLSVRHAHTECYFVGTRLALVQNIDFSQSQPKRRISLPIHLPVRELAFGSRRRGRLGSSELVDRIICRGGRSQIDHSYFPRPSDSLLQNKQAATLND